MKRREFMGLIGGAAAWPIAAPSQPTIDDLPLSKIWELPFTSGLLARARSTGGRYRDRDRDRVESILVRRSEMSGKSLKPIKWVEQFEEVYWLLARNPSLVNDLGNDPFWFAGRDVWRDPEPAMWPDLSRSMAAKRQAGEYFRCEERSEYLYATASRIDEQVLPSIDSWHGSWPDYERLFRAGRQAFRIADEMAYVASVSIGLIDFSIRQRHATDSDRVAILLTPIEAYESGLMATWETANEMICMLAPESLEMIA